MKPDQRYRAMAHNRGRTRPELALASALWHRGLRYVTSLGFKNRYGRILPGQPDMVFPKKRTVIFVDGCFWHGCPECKKNPEQSGDFWRDKIRTNMERDRRTTRCLEEEGWVVIRIPEHAIRTKESLEQTTASLVERLSREDIRTLRRK